MYEMLTTQTSNANKIKVNNKKTIINSIFMAPSFSFNTKDP